MSSVMKTFQQFNEDAAAQYRAGEIAYHSSAPAKLAARRSAAAERSRTAASDFTARQREKMQQTEDLHVEQTPTMDPSEYNKQIEISSEITI